MPNKGLGMQATPILWETTGIGRFDCIEDLEYLDEVLQSPNSTEEEKEEANSKLNSLLKQIEETAFTPEDRNKGIQDFNAMMPLDKPLLSCAAWGISHFWSSHQKLCKNLKTSKVWKDPDPFILIHNQTIIIIVKMVERSHKGGNANANNANAKDNDDDDGDDDSKAEKEAEELMELFDAMGNLDDAESKESKEERYCEHTLASIQSLYEEVDSIQSKPSIPSGSQPTFHTFGPMLVTQDENYDRVWTEMLLKSTKIAEKEKLPSFEVKTSATANAALEEMYKDVNFKPTEDQIKILKAF